MARNGGMDPQLRYISRNLGPLSGLPGGALSEILVGVQDF